MKDKFDSYLDSFNRITIIYPKKNITDIRNKKFFILIYDEMLSIEITSTEELEYDYKFSCVLPETISLNAEYTIIDEKNNRSILKSGSVVRTDLFEMLYYYSPNDLGVIYSKEMTSFKVWSPVAKEIELELLDREGNIEFHDLKLLDRGVWGIDIHGDIEGYKYRYRVRHGNSFKTTLDPYAISCDANGKYDYVIDLNKTYQFRYPKPEYSGKMVDAIIYELHIRDFTIDLREKNPYSGKYTGIYYRFETGHGLYSVMDYLKDLGITHVQLQPIYDFGGVDELEPDKWYNWGYNPVQYNIPEGWYSTNPNDPYARINELKQLIDEFHKNGIRVTMDVVYNHVYDIKSFPFETLVPGYYFRFDDSGNFTNVSGCKNDIASERKMVSKFICDSAKYWMEEFKIDGFRFDLMGLLDITTINNVHMIMKSIDSKAIMYGEGWNMPANIPEQNRANMNNYMQLPNVGFFNDRFRNIMKGNQWDKSLGFAAFGDAHFMDILYLLTGSCVDNYLLDSPNQSINYVECHDNYTYYDSLKAANKGLTEEQILDSCRLALSIVLVSQGVPFIHSGEEFYRTKQGVENSYDSPDSINKINWNKQSPEFIQMVKDLITIRKKYNCFRLDRKSLIKDRVKVNDGGYLRSVSLSIKGASEDILLIIKNNYKYDYFDFKGMVTQIFNSKRLVSKQMASIEITKPGVYIFTKGR